MAASQKKSYVLLVIDMQNHFQDIGQSILAELNCTIDACKLNKQNIIPVIYTQHGHTDLSVDAGPLGDIWGEENLIEYKSDDWKLMAGLRIDDNDKIIDEKRTYDAFHKTSLEENLRDYEIGTVVISGVITELCCETTARSAFVKGFNVVFLSDGTNSHDRERHNSTLATIEYGFGKVMTCKEFRTIIDRVHS